MQGAPSGDQTQVAPPAPGEKCATNTKSTIWWPKGKQAAEIFCVISSHFFRPEKGLKMSHLEERSNYLAARNLYDYMTWGVMNRPLCIYHRAH